MKYGLCCLAFSEERKGERQRPCLFLVDIYLWWTELLCRRCVIRGMRHEWLVVCALWAGGACGFAQQANPADAALSAGEIMSRVAANQDKAEAERSHYVYVQHARVASRKGKTIRCEETTDSRITPSANGYEAQLLKLDGRMLVKGKYVTYTALPEVKDKAKTDGKTGAKSDEKKEDDDSLSVQIGDGTMDRDIVENMRSGLIHDKSKDGLSARLFPLTSKDQTDYWFRLVGRERMNGRDVFHIEFHPKDKNDFGWKGDAYVDTAAYQPVLVSTAMARKIPFAVRTLLGTNLPGLGFSVVYAPQPDGVWFPTSFGTEFKMRILFFLTREISIDAHNVDFEKTHVSSRIVEAEGAAPQQ